MKPKLKRIQNKENITQKKPLPHLHKYATIDDPSEKLILHSRSNQFVANTLFQVASPKPHFKNNKASQKKMLHHHFNQKEETFKLPFINSVHNQQLPSNKRLILHHDQKENFIIDTNQKRNHKKKNVSIKKIITEPTEERIMRESRDEIRQLMHHVMNHRKCTLEQQIDKLDILTKRCSFLRQDLSDIQNDMFTINLKKIMLSKDAISTMEFIP